jgi:hypothetical protein
MALTCDELMAGGRLRHEIEIPRDLLNGAADAQVSLQPLTVRDLQLIAKAAKDDDTLSAALMIQRALVEPEMELDQIQRLPAGLARFLVERINAVSGIEVPQNALQEMVQAPLAKACFVLAREFGWTPEEVSGMTIGQILLFLEMSQQEAGQRRGGTA